MPHYKDGFNRVYWLDSESEEHFLPVGCVRITDAEADTLREAILKAEFDALSYAQKRTMEYPDLREYLDGIVKGDQAQIDKYIADCLAVKAKYPKPA